MIILEDKRIEKDVKKACPSVDGSFVLAMWLEIL